VIQLLLISALVLQTRDTLVTDSMVQHALDVGSRAKNPGTLGLRYTIKQPGFRNWNASVDVIARGPEARIAASGDPDLRAPEVVVVAQPKLPYEIPRFEELTRVEAIWLEPESGPIVRPTQLDTLVKREEYFEVTLSLVGMRAVFPLRALPRGEFDIVILLSNGREHHQTVGGDGRRRLLRGQ
jgi:hypothetical protein